MLPRNIPARVGCALALLFCIASCSQAGDPWRSALYPKDWTPGFKDEQGRFLHDFSYAGYHRGEVAIPSVKGPVLDVTQPPFNADGEGKSDATAAIQAAIDQAGQAGGGVVYLPAGTYRIRPPAGEKAALRLRISGVVLRGAGTDKTCLYNDTFLMREKTVISVRAETPADWHDEQGVATSPITSHLPNMSTVIPISDASLFAPGDLVVLRADHTQRFIDEHGMTGKWKPAGAASSNRTLIFCRRVVASDPAANTLTIDVPTRYPMHTEDKARVCRVKGTELKEVGIEDLSIGMMEHPGEGWDELDYQKEGTVGYDAHSSRAISMGFAENCWVRRVNSYCPPGNAKGFHILSNSIGLYRSRHITVEDCDFRLTQYRGGGGNGYHYTLNGSDCLVRKCHGERGRHNFDIGTMAATGNAIVDCSDKDASLASDFHMFLSPANLFDSSTCDGSFLEARAYRPWGGNPPHGLTSTQSVFWNTHGLRYPPKITFIVESRQFGDGYVIGTRGPAHEVSSDDFVEGVGLGDTLEPQSLYADQLTRRLATLKSPVGN
jgi:hypothetical protein